MAVYALYIEKATDYFGALRPLGNTYHYNVVDPGVPDFEQLATIVSDAEKAVTSSVIRFTGWKAWGPTDGTEFENVMQDEGELTGQGAINPDTELYREACALIVWPMPRSPITNRRRWLRKFLRNAVGTAQLPAGAGAGAQPLSAANRERLKIYADTVQNPVPGTIALDLCSADGTEPSDEGIVREYLYTRQIGS